MSEYQNIGLLFNRHYFKKIDFSKIDFSGNTSYEPNEKELQNQNKKLLDSEFKKENVPEALGLQTIPLQTTYPGLFTGSGLAHESSVKGELKLGFHFDYTSGLPCIPGSSVKGVLRSAFEKAGGNYVRYLLKDELKIDKEVDIKALENEIFEGADKSIYQRDIFFDAFPISTKNGLLGDDSITPHGENPLKNPTPLPFLKVLPQVEFEFRFDLKDGLIEADEKIELFRQILLDLGVGAKTNVGYGQLTEDDATKKKREQEEKEIEAQKAREEAKKKAKELERQKIEQKRIKQEKQQELIEEANRKTEEEKKARKEKARKRRNIAAFAS